MADAAHAEYGASPDEALIIPAACAVPEPGAPRLRGKQRVRLAAGSLAERFYGASETFAEFHCSNELNRRYQPLFERSDLRVSRSEEHTSELQSPYDLVCRLLLEKKK